MPEKDISTQSMHIPSGTPHRMVGAYKLLQKIGEGGMGTVWMADQEQPVRRRVALKLVREGFNSKEVITRFEAERQALAMMDHPAIAKVLDAGVTSDGQPFFAMELVQGKPITEYADEKKLTLQERLDLFIATCHAIHHAHQKGIIHRDIKPSNILVTDCDGRATPKVIDFGLAKALQHQTRLTDKTLFTEIGQVVGTLNYMSPEQAQLDTMGIDIRTDVYALGVLLYELLSGTTPIEKDTAKKNAFLAVLEMIRTIDPPKPSTRLKESSNNIKLLSSMRQTEPKRLCEFVRGDLDCITMRALEKDRNRRFDSASAFAADIQRFLDDRPIESKPPTTLYLLWKFTKRNKWKVATSLAIVILSVAALFGTTIGLLRAKHAEAEAIRLKDQNERNFKAANDALQRVEALLSKLLGTDHPDTIRQLVDLAEVLKDNGQPVEARKYLDRAYESYVRVLGEAHPQTDHVKRLLGQLER